MTIVATRRRDAPGGLRRWLAAGGACLVLVLAVLAASPALHQWLHADAGQEGHQCAITLFAHGFESGGAALALIIFPVLRAAATLQAAADPAPAVRRYLLLPGRGPPGR